MAGGRGSGVKIQRQERKNKAIQLRKAGASYRSIASALAKEFGETYSHMQAFRDVDDCLTDLAENTRHETEAYRQLELERLDDLLRNLQEKIRAGDVKAIDSAVRISDRRCKILGLDRTRDTVLALKVEEGIEFELRQFLAQLGSILDEATFKKVLTAYEIIEARAGEAQRN